MQKPDYANLLSSRRAKNLSASVTDKILWINEIVNVECRYVEGYNKICNEF